MACYSSNFGNKLQMMVGMGKEYNFTLNFDMPRPFATRETKLRCRLSNSLLYPRVEVEQRSHSGDEIENNIEIQNLLG